MNHVEIGSRWKVKSGHEWQVIKHDQEDYRVVECAPVFDGVLNLDKHRIVTLAVRYLTAGIRIR